MQTPLQLVILMPVRDDWTSATELIRRLDQTLREFPCSVEVIVVDDHSITPWSPVPDKLAGPIHKIRSVRLRRNLSHQRAIAVGLAYVEQNIPCDAVMVMDADGEDTPEGALQLLKTFVAHQQQKAIFAARSRRSETMVFKLFYSLYKTLHLMLTGIPVRIGNFSVLPSAHLRSVVVLSELWNHYAAAIVRSRLPLHMEPIPRGHRIAGKSTMNFVSLVTHGLSAISVFSDIVGTRLLLASIVGTILSMSALIAVVAVRLFTETAVPGWATYTSGLLVLATLQFLGIATTFHFFLLSSRSTPGFIPMRDYQIFVDQVSEVYHRG